MAIRAVVPAVPGALADPETGALRARGAAEVGPSTADGAARGYLDEQLDVIMAAHPDTGRLMLVGSRSRQTVRPFATPSSTRSRGGTADAAPAGWKASAVVAIAPWPVPIGGAEAIGAAFDEGRGADAVPRGPIASYLQIIAPPVAAGLYVDFLA